MDAILSLALTETAEALKVDRGLILRLKYHDPLNLSLAPGTIPPAKVEVVLLWQKSSKQVTDSNLPSFELSESPLTMCACQKAPESVAISSAQELANLELGRDREGIFALEQVEALLMVPMFAHYSPLEDKAVILGFLCLENYQVRQWTDAQIEMAKWISLQASSSIINQQTLQKVQSLVDERTAQLKMSLEVQAKLSEKMRHHLEELRRSNEIKDRFIASLSDALRAPLANMKMSIKMLKLVADNAQSERYLNILENECEKEINLINNLLTLQKLEEKKIDIDCKKIYIEPIVTEFIANFSQEWSDKKLEINLKCQQEFIYTDLNSFKLILKELLHNAGRFSLAGSEVNLSIHREGDTVNVIEVENVGFAIPEGEQDKIFQPFYQSQTLENVTNSGTGLGLALVKSLVENLNGKIAVSSIPYNHKGDYLTTFTLRLPQPSH